MSSIEKRTRNGKVTWRAHYRDPARRQRSRTFTRKGDAERFLTTVEASKLTGSYVDPGAGRVMVEAWSRRWGATQGHLKPSTLARYEGVLSKHVVPRWGTVRLSAITHSEHGGSGRRARQEPSGRGAAAEAVEDRAAVPDREAGR